MASDLETGMKVMGIDPGYDRLGIAIIEKAGNRKETVLYSACFTTDPHDSIHVRLHGIGKEVSRIIEEYKPDRLAIETLFISKNQKTAMRVAEARGIIIYQATERNIPVLELGPMEIKVAITGDGSSDKERMIKMVGLLVKLPARKRLDDEYDAIAVALAGAAL